MTNKKLNVHSLPDLRRNLGVDVDAERDTITPPAPPTERDNAVPEIDIETPREYKEYAEYERLLRKANVLEIPRHEGDPPLLLPCTQCLVEVPVAWERAVKLSTGGVGRLTVKRLHEGGIVVEIGITTPGGPGLIRWAPGSVDSDVRDLLANAREGIDCIPDELWELMAAPLEGETR